MLDIEVCVRKNIVRGVEKVGVFLMERVGGLVDGIFFVVGFLCCLICLVRVYGWTGLYLFLVGSVLVNGY